MKTVAVTIHGRVQGVGFRATLQARARAVGVAGWCRNTAEGEVEGVLQGPGEAVDRVLQWCQQGPPWAAVERVDVDRIADEPQPAPFEIRR